MNDTELSVMAGTLRCNTFQQAINIARTIRVKCIIETGTWRGIEADGQSTRILSAIASELGADFYSIDNCAEHISRSRSKMAELGIANVRHDLCDSVVFLSLFCSPIHFLYLDSYDFSKDNPIPAQIHQVAEIGAAFGKLANKCIVLLDDCNIEGGGKGLFSTQFLLERGWNCRVKSYQNLLTNF